MRRSIPLVSLFVSLFGSLLVIPLALIFALPAQAAPLKETHSLPFFVHIDMIDPGAGRDLAYFQQLIGERTGDANVLIQGHQGPADVGCCVELDPVSVTTFGSPGDGLDIISNASDMASVQANGPGAYLVQTIQYCAGNVGSGIRGCGVQPGNFFIVSLDAEDTKFLSIVIAHERGHNAGLGHTSSSVCELMQSLSGGGCLSLSACNAFIAKADTSGGVCDCLGDVPGDSPLPMGESCGSGLVCSEGICGDLNGLAGAELISAGGPGTSTGVNANEILSQSPATGGWSAVAGAGSEISGLAYDRGNDILYGIEVLSGDDALVVLDPDTGAVVSTIGLLGGRDGTIALAFDPRPSGDRLLAIHVDDDFYGTPCSSINAITPPCVSELFEIDPSNASVSRLGELNQLIITDGVTGLAWDDASGTLYGTTPAGIDILELSGCDGFVCGNTPISSLYRDAAALGFDPVTGRLLRQGDNGYGLSTFDVVDPATGEIETTIGVDAFTAGGLAVRDVPELGLASGLLFGVAALVALDRVRGRRVWRRAA